MDDIPVTSVFEIRTPEGHFPYQRWAQVKFFFSVLPKVEPGIDASLRQIYSSSVSSIRRAVEDWAVKYNLTSEEDPQAPAAWCVTFAERYINWLNDGQPGKPEHLIWSIDLVPFYSLLPIEPESFFFISDFVYNPSDSTRAEAEKRILKEVKDQLQVYLDERDLDAKEVATRQAIELSSVPKINRKHLEWLAYFKAKKCTTRGKAHIGWSINKIASASKVSRSSVEQAIDKSAALIKLSGRPHKTLSAS
jgi:hypothetical protein